MPVSVPSSSTDKQESPGRLKVIIIIVAFFNSLSFFNSILSITAHIIV